MLAGIARRVAKGRQHARIPVAGRGDWNYGRTLTIDLPPVPDPKHENADNIVIDAGHDPPITHAVLPELSEFRSAERFPNAARIIKLCQPFGKKSKNPPRDGAVQCLQFFGGFVGEFNAPG